MLFWYIITIVWELSSAYNVFIFILDIFFCLINIVLLWKLLCVIHNFLKDKLFMGYIRLVAKVIFMLACLKIINNTKLSSINGLITWYINTLKLGYIYITNTDWEQIIIGINTRGKMHKRTAQIVSLTRGRMVLHIPFTL